MTYQFEELDVVTVRAAHGPVHAGSKGTVLEVFRAPQLAYLVEFSDDQGREIDTLTLTPDQLQPLVTA